MSNHIKNALNRAPPKHMAYAVVMQLFRLPNSSILLPPSTPESKSHFKNLTKTADTHNKNRILEQEFFSNSPSSSSKNPLISTPFDSWYFFKFWVFHCCLNLISMESGSEKKHVYSVWGLPPEDLKPRLKKLMESLRSEFNGPEFEPHVTVVGAIRLTESEAREKFNKACEVLKAYSAKVLKVDTGTFFYQCVFLLLDPSPAVVQTSDHCCGHFGYLRSTAYMPHLSLLYADLLEEEKKAAREKAYALDETIGSLNFEISRLALCKTDTEDRSLKSWEKVLEYQLDPN